MICFCLKKIKVGDPEKEHQCWVRPENMKQPRPVLEINEKRPGTEIAAETSAALAASSIVFRHIDRPYAHRLLNRAKMVPTYAVLIASSRHCLVMPLLLLLAAFQIC